MKSGLVSISFRPLAPREIIEKARAVSLKCIEWGGDVHVPPGNLANAIAIGSLTREAGLAVAAYGSYYRVGATAPETFEAVANTAAALEAPLIRVWAYTRGSAEILPEEYSAVLSDTRRICRIAAAKGITVTFECHSGTLTDDFHSALRLLQETNEPNLRLYWQPNQFRDFAYNLEAAAATAPYLAGIHIFHWDASRRYSLLEGTEQWAQYLRMLKGGRDVPILLEFMPDDRLESLPREAAVLHELLAKEEG